MIGSRLTSSVIDYGTPVRWTSPLNRGLVAWYLALPGLKGDYWRNLCSPTNLANAGTLVNMAYAGSNGTSGWQTGGNRPGHLGAGIGFDGVDDNVTTTYTPSVPFSVSCWFWPQVTTAWQVVSNYNAATGGFMIGISATNYIFSVGDPGGNTNVLASGAVAGKWVHLLATINAGPMAALYVNGVRRTTNALAVMTTSASGVNIGKFAIARLGFVDDVRLWNRDLQVEEAKQVYQDSVRWCAGTLNRVAWPSYFASAAGVLGKAGMKSGGNLASRGIFTGGAL